MKEYRCTMPENYPSPYEGFKNPMVRQGHYIDAENEEEAAQVMFERYPSLKVVDVQLFEKGKTSPQITRVNRS